MTTFALVGAGPGLGLAAARRFGEAGHRVALLSRSAQHQDSLAAVLARENIRARGFTADVLGPAPLTEVCAKPRTHWGRSRSSSSARCLAATS